MKKEERKLKEKTNITSKTSIILKHCGWETSVGPNEVKKKNR